MAGACASLELPCLCMFVEMLIRARVVRCTHDAHCSRRPRQRAGRGSGQAPMIGAAAVTAHSGKAAASTEQSGQQPGRAGGGASSVQLAGRRPPGGGAGQGSQAAGWLLQSSLTGCSAGPAPAGHARGVLLGRLCAG